MHCAVRWVAHVHGTTQPVVYISKVCESLSYWGRAMARLGWTGLLATIVFVSAVAVTVPTEHEQHSDHGHAATGAALVSQMQLNESRRWPTDASLRAGMLEIRTVFDAHHPRIHAGTQSDAEYDELSTIVEKSVNRIVGQCKLPAAADAQLHYVVGDLLRRWIPVAARFPRA